MPVARHSRSPPRGNAANQRRCGEGYPGFIRPLQPGSRGIECRLWHQKPDGIVVIQRAEKDPREASDISDLTRARFESRWE